MRYLNIQINIAPFEVAVWEMKVHSASYVNGMYAWNICFGPIRVAVEWEKKDNG